MGRKQNGSSSTVTAKLVHLTADEVRHLPRAHTGFETFAPELATFYEANEDTLRIKGLDPEKMRDALGAYEALAEAEVAAQKQLQLIQETRLYYSAQVWSPMLEIYVRAKVVARTDQDIARGIDDFAAFMKHARRKKSVPPSTT